MEDQPPKPSKGFKEAKLKPVTLPLAFKTAAAYKLPSPHDVKLSFGSSGDTSLDLWTSSALLSSVSTFYKDMFASGMQEAADSHIIGASTSSSKRKAPESEDQAAGSATGPANSASAPPAPASAEIAGQSGDDSDTEADVIYQAEEAANQSELETSVSVGRPHKAVEVTHAKYSTYVALLAWLQSGRITFAPLKSSFATSATRVDTLRKAIKKAPHQPLPVSAKSVYKLANFLDIPSLAKLALDAYMSQIEVRLAADEVFCSMLNFPEVKPKLVQYIEKNKDKFKKSGGLDAVRAKLRRGEFVGVEEEVIDVLAGLV